MSSVRARRLVGVATLVPTVAMLFFVAILASTDIRLLPLWAQLVKPITSLVFVWLLVVFIRLIVVLSPDPISVFDSRGELDRLLQGKRRRYSLDPQRMVGNEAGRDPITVAERLREGAWEAVQRGCLDRLVTGKHRRDSVPQRE